jgi:hypothetical protein
MIRFARERPHQLFGQGTLEVEMAVREESVHTKAGDCRLAS